MAISRITLGAYGWCVLGSIQNNRWDLINYAIEISKYIYIYVMHVTITNRIYAQNYVSQDQILHSLNWNFKCVLIYVLAFI